jgi:hypothetical protein
MPWPENLHEVPVENVPGMDFDCILFQSARNYLVDQHEILTEAQRLLPRIYLEHDPPRESPTDTRHPVDDPDVLLVHVTHFNRLMWDAGRTPTAVIEHGVMVPEGLTSTGQIARGICVVNNLPSRGRRLGSDVFDQATRFVPLDLVGMGSRDLGGLGELARDELFALEANYRFFFNPIRYTSLGLAVCEAMMLGVPIVGLATTEMVTVIENGVSGFLDTNVDGLIERMRELLEDPELASRLGSAAREAARECFSIERFVADWEETFSLVSGLSSSSTNASTSRLSGGTQ